MAKVQIKPEKLTPFGGIFSIMEQFASMLSPVIDSTLGQRCSSIINENIHFRLHFSTISSKSSRAKAKKRLRSQKELKPIKRPL